MVVMWSWIDDANMRWDVFSFDRVGGDFFCGEFASTGASSEFEFGGFPIYFGVVGL